uniref:Uncharacterized protein n=1 Tax=Zea mays TaxID=4577 RepID=C0P9A3_MAIZE|nr:unknown [Zea mays]
MSSGSCAFFPISLLPPDPRSSVFRRLALFAPLKNNNSQPISSPKSKRRLKFSWFTMQRGWTVNFFVRRPTGSNTYAMI